MTHDRSGSAHLSAKEREAGKRAGQKHLNRKGLPQDPTSAEQRDAANHQRMTVTKNPEPSPHKIIRAVGEE